MKAGHFLQTFVNKATIASLHESMLQHSGATDAIAILNKANDSCGNSMNTAVAAATADKFIFSIWDGGFIIAHRFLVDSISWVEWEAGPCASRFGSLRFSFHPDRMQQPDCRIGIVKIPNETSTAFPDDDVWGKLATWISADAPMLVTGNFGHGNDEGIAQTAVAAGASVDRRIRVSFNVEGMDGVAQSPGGFVIFAPCKKSIEEVSVFSEIEEAHKMGHDLIDAMEFNNPTWRTASGNDARGYIGNARFKKGFLEAPVCRHDQLQALHRLTLARQKETVRGRGGTPIDESVRCRGGAGACPIDEAGACPIDESDAATTAAPPSTALAARGTELGQGLGQ
jgi:hypothetical protein